MLLILGSSFYTVVVGSCEARTDRSGCGSARSALPVGVVFVLKALRLAAIELKTSVVDVDFIWIL